MPDSRPATMPQIAIFCPNTLAALGLADLIRRMMPGVEACLFGCFKDLETADRGQFFHYFVAAAAFLPHAAYFLPRQRRTIVLTGSNDIGRLPQGIHTLNVHQPERQLACTLLRLSQTAHGMPGREPEPVRKAKQTDPAEASKLTQRERDVLRLIVEGLINKEIADRLNVKLTTVLSHRKNLTKKLKTKNVAALTIYAVTHGIINIEDI